MAGLPIGLILPVGAALLYESAAQLRARRGRLLPPPSRVGQTLWSLAATGELWTHIAATMLRRARRFSHRRLAGILLGALTGSSRTASRLLDPTVQALRAIPSIAWVPLFILWLGIFEASKIALIAVGVFFPVYLGVMARDHQRRPQIRRGRARVPFAAAGIDTPHSLAGDLARLCRRACDQVLALASCLSLRPKSWVPRKAWAILLVDGQQLGKPDQILAAIFVFAMLGKICDGALVAAFRPFLRWQDSLRKACRAPLPRRSPRRPCRRTDSCCSSKRCRKSLRLIPRRSPTCRSKSAPARSSRSSAVPAVARPRCCAS